MFQSINQNNDEKNVDEKMSNVTAAGSLGRTDSVSEVTEDVAWARRWQKYTRLHVEMHVHHIHVYTYLCIYLLSNNLSIYLSVYLSIYLILSYLILSYPIYLSI